MTEAPSAARTPVHLWVVGILTLLWNAMGAMDYFMTQTENESYMSKFSPEQIEYYTNFPTWTVFFWALAVWGAVLGSILLLLRRRLAFPVYLVSFLSMVVTTIYTYFLSNGAEVSGGVGNMIFSAVIFLVALALVFYSRAMTARGVLR